MKSIVFISIIILSIIISSCKPIILRVAGLRIPRVESKRTIESFLRKVGNNQQFIYALDTTLYEQLRSQPFKPGWPSDFRPIQIRAYNKNGSPIMHWASCEGYLKALKTFDTVPPRNQVNLDSTLNLQQDLDRYFTLDGRHADIHAESGYDYYIILYFAKYFPRMSKASFGEVDSYCKNHPELKIKVYYINVDVLDWWDAEIVNDLKIH